MSAELSETLQRRDVLGAVGAVTAAAVLTAEGWADAAALLSRGTPDARALAAAGYDIRHTLCFQCSAQCGLTALVKRTPKPNERGFVVFGNQHPDHPQRGMCGRGATAIQTWESPLRIRKPLKRVGPRGSGEFREISWAQALDEIAERLRAVIDSHGVNALCFTGHDLIRESFWLAMGLGAPNTIGHPSTCNTAGVVARRWVLGPTYAHHAVVDPDYENVRFVLFPGRTLHAPIGAQFRLAKARAKGAKVAFLNPAHPDSAFANAEWIPCRPGTDAAFLLGVANVLVRDRRFDETFLRRYTNLPFLLKPDGKPLTEADLREGGQASAFIVFDAKAERLVRHDDAQAEPALAHEQTVLLRDGSRIPVMSAWTRLVAHLADYTPDRASAICDVPADVIERIARQLAETQGVVEDTWYNTRNGESDSDAIMAILLVNALLANFDRRGGLCFRGSTGLPEPISRAADGTVRTILGGELKLPPPARRLDVQMFPETNGTFEAVVRSVVDGAGPHTIRALMTTDAALFWRDPNTKRIEEMLRKLDLLVVCDILRHEACDWADYVLPGDMFLERGNLHTIAWSLAPAIAAAEPVTKPPRGVEARPLSWISLQLLRRLHPDRAAALGWQDRFDDPEVFSREFLGAIEAKQLEAVAARWKRDPAELREALKRDGFVVLAPLEYGTVPYRRAPETPSRKIELYALHPVLRGLRAHGFPRHVEPTAYTVPRGQDEFYLVNGKSPSGSSGAAGLAFSSQFLADNAVWIHPEDAKRFGLKTGDLVELTGLDTGWTARTKVKVTPRVHRGTLFAYSYVGGHRAQAIASLKKLNRLAQGINTQWFATGKVDPATGANFNNASVRLRRLAVA